MKLTIRYHKIVLLIIITAMFLIGNYFNLDLLIQGFGLLIMVSVYIYMTKSALNNLWDCLYYLALVAPIVGASLSYYVDNSNFITDFPFSDYIYYVIAYFFIWLLVVIFGELKTVKFATLIIAQVLTALFLIINLALYLIPIQTFNEFIISSGISLTELNQLYGYDSRKFFEITLQILLYPALLNALLTYIIAELRQYKAKENKTQSNLNNVG